MCTERQKFCKYQCCGIFAKGMNACDGVSCFRDPGKIAVNTNFFGRVAI